MGAKPLALRDGLGDAQRGDAGAVVVYVEPLLLRKLSAALLLEGGRVLLR